MKRTFVAVLLIISLVILLSACKEDKETRVEYCELGIVLGENFETYDSDGAFSVAYSSPDAIVGITRYSFVDCHEYGFLSTLTPERFAEVYLDKSGKSEISSVASHGDVPYYSYVLTDDVGNEYFYMPTFYRTPYAYFVITFITPSALSGEMKDVFLEYTETAYIINEYM